MKFGLGFFQNLVSVHIRRIADLQGRVVSASPEATMIILQTIHTNNHKRDGILFVSSNILCPAGGSIVARYDIFKKIDASVLWVEAVEDIVTVKKRLLSLGLRGMDDYCVWDSMQQQFIDVMDDRA